VLLRRLSLSHANKPRKYEGYYANAKKDAGLDHGSVLWLMGPALPGWPDGPSTIGLAGVAWQVCPGTRLGAPRVRAP